MTTALFLLRCAEIGVSIADMDLLTIGMLTDMFVEKGNDSVEAASENETVYLASQEDMDRF